MKHNEYVFILGDETKRVYNGRRLSPFKGSKLGLRFGKLIASAFKDANIENKKVSLSRILDSTVSDKETLSDTLIILAEALNSFNEELFFSLVKEVIENTWIAVKIEGQHDSHIISSIPKFDEWFEKYPEDLLIFSAQILFKNSTPFLPKNWLQSILSIK